MKKGFTLIELLVVVLIVGVLAAAALPQYERAVTKSRFAQIVTGAQNIQNAQTRYFLANGKYASSLSDLDVQIKGKSETENYVYWDWGHCHMLSERLDCEGGPPSFVYTIFYQTGQRVCCAYPTDGFAAVWLCKSALGGPQKTVHTQYCWTD